MDFSLLLRVKLDSSLFILQRCVSILKQKKTAFDVKWLKWFIRSMKRHNMSVSLNEKGKKWLCSSFTRLSIIESGWCTNQKKHSIVLVSPSNGRRNFQQNSYRNIWIESKDIKAKTWAKISMQHNMYEKYPFYHVSLLYSEQIFIIAVCFS